MTFHAPAMYKKTQQMPGETPRFIYTRTKS